MGPVSRGSVRRSPSEDDVQLLRRCDLFEGLDDRTIGEVTVMMRQRHYASGAIIADVHDSDPMACVIAGGSARLYQVSREGRESTLARFDEGSLFGLPLLPRRDRVDGMLEATSNDTAVCHIPGGYLQRLMRSHPDVSIRLVEHFGHQLAGIIHRYAEHTLHDVRTRLAHHLADLAMQDTERRVHETHASLALDIGARQDEVTKAIGVLRREGLIQTRYRRPGIQVLALAGLLEY